MSEQFHVLFDSEPEAERAEAQLRVLEVEGAPAMLLSREGPALFTGCKIFRPLAKDAVLRAGPNKARPFFDLFYQGDGIKSGMHHPDGFLWIRTPEREHTVRSQRVALRSVAPTVLEMFGVARPAYMSAPPLS
jgi:hypothetical protein